MRNHGRKCCTTVLYYPNFRPQVGSSSNIHALNRRKVAVDKRSSSRTYHDLVSILLTLSSWIGTAIVVTLIPDNDISFRNRLWREYAGILGIFGLVIFDDWKCWRFGTG